ncbi:uncharacterized protein G2W53_024832 [Senna tora]|uniref:Uncharacterized protein n=1 Tax=Senna tora TaxID=362788 RepID=A0A834TE87_9FABA|nr:uncharacterized protein G2W53_024832 [Senna tora]
MGREKSCEPRSTSLREGQGVAVVGGKGMRGKKGFLVWVVMWWWKRREEKEAWLGLACFCIEHVTWPILIGINLLSKPTASAFFCLVY